MPNQDLYNEFYKIVQTGDDKAARAFLTAHFNEFPETLQDELTGVFFEEALANETASAEAVTDFKAKALEFLRELGQTKSMLEDEKGKVAVKEDLGL